MKIFLIVLILNTFYSRSTFAESELEYERKILTQESQKILDRLKVLNERLSKNGHLKTKSKRPYHTKIKEVLNSTGTEGGGGDLEAKFLSESWRVISRIERMDQDVVDADDLFIMMDSLRVIVWDTLLDPYSGEPIRNQKNLYAYGSKGLIQIKPNWEWKFQDPDFQIDHDIAHELLRATGLKKYTDHGYRISIGKLHLERPENFIITDGLHSFQFNEVPLDPQSCKYLENRLIDYNTDNLAFEFYCYVSNNTAYLSGAMTVLNDSPPYLSKKAWTRKKVLKTFKTTKENEYDGQLARDRRTFSKLVKRPVFVTSEYKDHGKDKGTLTLSFRINLLKEK